MIKYLNTWLWAGNLSQNKSSKILKLELHFSFSIVATENM